MKDNSSPVSFSCIYQRFSLSCNFGVRSEVTNVISVCMTYRSPAPSPSPRLRSLGKRTARTATYKSLYTPPSLSPLPTLSIAHSPHRSLATSLSTSRPLPIAHLRLLVNDLSHSRWIPTTKARAERTSLLVCHLLHPPSTAQACHAHEELRDRAARIDSIRNKFTLDLQTRSKAHTP